MPEVIPGTGLDKKQAIIVGGVGLLGVGLILWIRSRSSGTVPEAAFPSDEGFGGGGGGIPMAVSAPNEAQASWYEQQLQAADIEAAKLQNEYLGQQMRQQASQFELQQEERRFETGIFQGIQRAYAELETTTLGTLNQAAKKAKVQCPKGEHLVNTPEGGLHCQPKGGGGFSFKTLFTGVGEIARGFLGGVAQAAPGIGYGAAQYGAVEAGLLPGRNQSPARQRRTGRPMIPPYNPPSPYQTSYTPNPGAYTGEYIG
jgi:hypothetical protein